MHLFCSAWASIFGGKICKWITGQVTICVKWNTVETFSFWLFVNMTWAVRLPDALNTLFNNNRKVEARQIAKNDIIISVYVTWRGDLCQALKGKCCSLETVCVCVTEQSLCVWPAPSGGLEHSGAVTQWGDESPLKDNKWLHGKTAIEILSVCGIKNNWTNRDKKVGRIWNEIFSPSSLSLPLCLSLKAKQNKWSLLLQITLQWTDSPREA